MHCFDGTPCCWLSLFFLLAVFFLTTVSVLLLLQDIGAAGMHQAKVYRCTEI